MKQKRKRTPEHTKPTPATPPPAQPAELLSGHQTASAGREPRFRRLFYLSLAIMLAVLWIAGYDSGYHTDEMDMNAYGKANISWYSSGGKDTSFAQVSLEDGTPLPPTMKFYGSAFEYMATCLTTLLGDRYEYNTRHLLNQFLAVLAVFFAGLIARRVADSYRAAVITAWLLFLTPTFFGLSIFNTKDIPFLTGYAATVYFIVCFLETLPTPSWRTTVGLLAALAFTMSIRVGGVLLVAYLFLFGAIYWLTKKELRKELLPTFPQWALRLLVALGGALLITILSWPYVMQNPLPNLVSAINSVKHFPQRIPINFKGELIDSLHIPSDYLLTYMVLTIPIVVQLLFLSSTLYLLFSVALTRKRILLLVLFAAVFPVVYAVVTRMPVYNSWRHLLFVYPPMVVVAGTGLHVFMDRLKQPAFQWALAVVCALGMIGPVRWLVRTNPLGYMYYNELAGGFGKAYYEYESDYWQISVKEAIDWLVAHEPLANAEDSVTVSTNAYSFARYYTSHRYPGLKIRWIRSSYRRRFLNEWRYGIFNSMFLTPLHLEYDFPPPGTIHRVDIDDCTLAAVVKDTNRFDRQGILAFQQSDFRRADSLFSLFIAQVGYQVSQPLPLEGLDPMIGFTKLALNDNDAALPYALKGLEYEPNNYFANLTAGVVYYSQGDLSKAGQYLNVARTVEPDDIYATRLLQQMGVLPRE
jgi:tetratricopeptide (TPR) repeat protein